MGCNHVRMDKIRTFAAHCSSERRAYAITSFFFWMPMTAVRFCLAFHNLRMIGFELILDVAFTSAKKISILSLQKPTFLFYQSTFTTYLTFHSLFYIIFY